MTTPYPHDDPTRAPADEGRAAGPGTAQTPGTPGPARWTPAMPAPAALYPPTHLGHALASEWTKIRTVRSTVWTLGAMFLLVIGIGFLVALSTSGDHLHGETRMLGGGLFGLILGQVAIITLGVLVITSEYGTGMIRTTMTACPVRGRVLLAKALVFFALAFVMTTVASGITALIQYAFFSGARVHSPELSYAPGPQGPGEPLTASGQEWFDATVGAGLYVALLGLFSLSVGAILRHSAGAITTMLGVVLLPVLVGIFMQGPALHDLRDVLLEFSALNGLAELFGTPLISSSDSGAWELLGGLAGLSFTALAVAYAMIERRDV